MLQQLAKLFTNLRKSYINKVFIFKFTLNAANLLQSKLQNLE
jgi:hypothetical protein